MSVVAHGLGSAAPTFQHFWKHLESSIQSSSELNYLYQVLIENVIDTILVLDEGIENEHIGISIEFLNFGRETL